MATIQHQKRAEMKMEDMGGGLKRALMLPDLFEGVETYKCELAAGSKAEPEVYSDKIQIFFFTKGTGYIGTKDRAHNITEVAVFVPMLDSEEFFIQAGTDMEYLNLVVKMNDFDYEEFNKVRMVLPSFSLLSNCVQYYEGFKGPSVKSYTIVEHDNLARISMGVVTGKGPDVVGEHFHTNLQQWYYGLADGSFRFSAEGETVRMEDGDFSCIPKGAKHSVIAEAGETINYVWFELKC